jgi:hypothetical protein
MKKEIVDIVVGTVEVVDMTTEEVKAYEAYKAKADAEIVLFVAKITKLETDKAALLAKLGITADEAKLLLS